MAGRYQQAPTTEPYGTHYGGYDRHPNDGYAGPSGAGGGYGQQQGHNAVGATGGYGQPGGLPSHGQPSGGSMGSPLKQMQSWLIMDLAFFGAACCLVVGGLLGNICQFFEFHLVAALNMFYITVFGLALAILDTPFLKTIKAISDCQMLISKYINVLTRVTGQGVCFVFLGSTLLASTFVNQPDIVTRTCSFITNSFVIIVGLAATVVGSMKSQKLRKAQLRLGQGTMEMCYDDFAKEYSRRVWGEQSGLTPPEFNALTEAHGGFLWQEADLKLIFNALVSNPASKMAQNQAQGGNHASVNDQRITMEDLKRWVYGGFVFL